MFYIKMFSIEINSIHLHRDKNLQNKMYNNVMLILPKMNLKYAVHSTNLLLFPPTQGLDTISM
jgi:hypothetical protein